MTLQVEAPVHEPYDIEAEQQVLGGLIAKPERVPEVAGILDDVHFYDPLHQRIYALIVAWSADDDMVITPTTLGAYLKSDPGIVTLDGMVGQDGGREYLKTLEKIAPYVTPLRHLARVIRDHALRRDALAALDEARAALLGGPTQVRDALVGVLGVGDEAERLKMESTFQATIDAADDVIRQTEAASAGKPVRSVKTGIKKLDDETGGFMGADLVIIAGKSGMGKSALMGGFSWRAAMAMYPTIVFSLEMKRAQWVQRLLTDIDFDREDIEEGIQYRKFRQSGRDINGRPLGFTHEEFSRIMFARDDLREFSPWLEIHDEDGLTMAQIAARARAFQAKWRNDPAVRAAQGCPDDEDPIGLVIVDYIQIVDPASRQYRPREQEVAGIARGLKGLAKKMDWPVVAGSQLNEDDKGRGQGAKRPQPGDVRESKVIRHEADIMLLPYRMAVALEDARPDAAPGEPAWNTWNADLKAAKNHFDIIIGKNRMGRKITVELFGDMASSAVRDEKPTRRAAQQLADDLLGRTTPSD